MYRLSLPSFYVKGFKWTLSYGFPHRNSVHTSHILRTKCLFDIHIMFIVSATRLKENDYLLSASFINSVSSIYVSCHVSAKLRPCNFHSLFLSCHCLQFRAVWYCWVGQNFIKYFLPLLILTVFNCNVWVSW